MRLIVDTNIIIAALMKNSLARFLLLHLDAELIAIHVSDIEIEKYKQLIIKKANLTDHELMMLLEVLKKRMIFFPENSLLPYWQEAKQVMDHIDPNDAPFIAAALATKADIWSDDKHFEKQKKIKIWKTIDLLKKI